MKRVLSWVGIVLLALFALGVTTHAATSEAAHAAGECIFCNLHNCLLSMLHS
jgi:hypothetical protein